MLKEKNDDLVHIYNNQPPSIATKHNFSQNKFPKGKNCFLASIYMMSFFGRNCSRF